MMARTSRRLAGSLAMELEHPLKLWQREVHSSASVEQARLLLSDVATERSRAGAADLAIEARRPPPHDSSGLRQSIEQWRSVAAGVAVGDAACLVALARGLAGERANRRLGDDTLDATLTALAMAARSGTPPERVVACIELLVTLPEIIGKSATVARRARGLAALFRAYRTLRWSASDRDGRDQHASTSSMMAAVATVEAAAIRRGIFHGGLDCEALFGKMADLLAAHPPTEGDDGVDGDDLPAGCCETDLLPSTRRIGLEGMGPGAEPPESLERPLSMIAFPKFDPNRLSDSRKVLGDRYAVLAKPLPITPVPPRQAVDAGLQALGNDMPNFRMVIERIGDELALSRCTASRAALRLTPMLLVGPPGIGKTTFAGRLAACLGLPWGCLAVAGSSDNRELAGTARGWSSAHPGWPVEQLVQLGTANPLLVIDEVDKAGGHESNGRAVMTMLTLLERRTSQAFNDECLGGPIDLSSISWILTANTTSGLPGPLLSRVSTLVVQAPSLDQVGVLLVTMQRDIAGEMGLRDSRLLPALPRPAIERLKAGYAAHGDPRRLRAELTRILAVAARAEELCTACPATSLH